MRIVRKKRERIIISFVNIPHIVERFTSPVEIRRRKHAFELLDER